jgi:uncharacterized protein
MINQVLIDSSFLYELNNPRTSRRTEVAEFARAEKRVRLVPEVVLTETTYLIRQRIGQHQLIRFLLNINAFGFQFEPIMVEDFKRAGEIMAQYHETDFDFVDCCLMALSERLQITTIYTLDRRNFTIFRPRHCDYLELLP